VLKQQLERTANGAKEAVRFGKIVHYQFVIDCEKSRYVVDTIPYELFADLVLG
jgi:hypothetical protein